MTAGDLSFTYDFEGQLADIDGTPYTFDGQHRLTNTGGAAPCQYSYDGAGNRLESIRNGVTTRYIYDASGNLLAEADEQNYITRYYITRYYIHGLGLLAMVTPSNDLYYCYHFNAIGNTIATTDQSQQIVNKYAYTPFGIITNAVEAVPQPFKYVGQYGVMAEPNGFYYMRARYYDPEVGRFISEDPIGFGGGDVNLYVYVKNNPIMFVDPSGLAVGDWWDLPANYGRAQKIGAEEKRNFAGHHNDLGDAMRHATWSKRTVEETNLFTAWSAGLAHEIDNLINDHGPWRETLMDSHNNQIGRDAAVNSTQIDQSYLRTDPKGSSGSYK